MKKRTYVVIYYEKVIHVFDVKKEARKVAKERKTKLTMLTHDDDGNVVEIAEEDYSEGRENEDKR